IAHVEQGMGTRQAAPAAPRLQQQDCILELASTQPSASEMKEALRQLIDGAHKAVAHPDRNRHMSSLSLSRGDVGYCILGWSCVWSTHDSRTELARWRSLSPVRPGTWVSRHWRRSSRTDSAFVLWGAGPMRSADWPPIWARELDRSRSFPARSPMHRNW